MAAVGDDQAVQRQVGLGISQHKVPDLCIHLVMHPIVFLVSEIPTVTEITKTAPITMATRRTQKGEGISAIWEGRVHLILFELFRISH